MAGKERGIMSMIPIIKPIGHRSDFNQIRGLMDLICELPDNLVWCEIGCGIGASSELWALRCQKLYCIDVWDIWVEGCPMSPAEIEGNFGLRMKKFGDKIVKLKGRSDDPKIYERIPDNSLDGFYIDGCHSREAVRHDILRYIPKLKESGYVTGHDFGNPATPAVREAVLETIDEPDFYFQDWSWMKVVRK